jgi:hypothetical protein
VEDAALEVLKKRVRRVEHNAEADHREDAAQKEARIVEAGCTIANPALKA